MMLNYEQRNFDFLRAVRRAARQHLELGETLNSRALVREVLTQPAPAWYISTDYTWRRLRLLESGKLPAAPDSLRMLMLSEIAAHLRRARHENPHSDPYALLDDILSGRGPLPSRFFISEEYALRLFTGSARRRATAIPRSCRGHRRRRPASLPPGLSATPCSILQ